MRSFPLMKIFVCIRKLKSYLIHQNHLQRKILAIEVRMLLFFLHRHQANILLLHVCIAYLPPLSIAIMDYLVPSPSTRVVNNSQVNGAQSSSSRNCTLSTSNPSAIASPLSPLNTNSNHHDQNSRSMSPRLSGDQPSIPNPTTTSINIDPLASVGGFPFE